VNHCDQIFYSIFISDYYCVPKLNWGAVQASNTGSCVLDSLRDRYQTENMVQSWFMCELRAWSMRINKDLFKLRLVISETCNRFVPLCEHLTGYFSFTYIIWFIFYYYYSQGCIILKLHKTRVHKSFLHSVCSESSTFYCSSFSTSYAADNCDLFLSLWVWAWT